MTSDFHYAENISIAHLQDFLIRIDGSFEPRISQRVNLKEYSLKLFENAEVLCFLDPTAEKIVAAVVVYCNDEKKENAYIPIVAVLKEFRGLGLTKELFRKLEDRLKKEKFKFLSLETWLGGDALAYYIKTGFYIEEAVSDRPNNGISMKMRKRLSVSTEHFTFPPTPLNRASNLSRQLGINLFIKQDDLFAIPGGGSKARKLMYILKKANNQGCDAVVTAGGLQSNHVRATALMATKLGMKTAAIIHSEEPKDYEGNLKLTALTGAKLVFTEMKDVKRAMDIEVINFIEAGKKPFYIWGGGHSVEGAFSYYDAVFELKEQLKGVEPDYIIVASGTGTTQAGIEVGVKKLFPNCNVLGVSIAREKTKGARAVVDSANELITYLDINMEPLEEVFFDDSKMGEGYESTFPELEETLHKVALSEGLILDATYSGKAFYGLENYIKDGKIPSGSNVVFWHTGGLLNLMASPLKLKR